jgi:hypothetical protein
MNKLRVRILNAFLLLIIFVYNANAQYEIEKHYAGPTIGLSFLGSTAQLGLNYEYAFIVEDFGTVGAGGIFRYFSYEESFSDGRPANSFTDVIFGGQFNYHFKVVNNKIDPWLGLVLAYDFEPSHGGVWFGFQGGARYWITPTIALMGKAGFGTLSYGSLDLGVDFKF